MDRSYTMPRLCFVLTAALTVFGVVLRSLCMIFYFDTDPGYFASGFMPALSNILYFVAVAVAIVCSCLIPKNSLPNELHTRMRTPTALLLGLALAIFTALALIVCFPVRRSNIMIAPTLMGLLASTYYFVSGNRNGRYPDWLAFLGYLPVLWSVAAVGEVYFDNYTTMNSPVKIALQMAFLGFMFIALAELRFRVGRPMPRYSVAMLSMGSFACLTGSVPILIATGARMLDNVLHLLYAVVLLFAGLYGLYLLFRYTCFPSDAPSGETAEDTANTPEATVPNAE
ncbi:MAG: hypothetical protein IJX72_06635 [Clostridia bacterium]|nr:hypothetical protein [Clostridia bacterium]